MIGRATSTWAFFLGAAVGAAYGGASSAECPTGSNDCPCTPGGGCDPGNTCVDGTCVSIASFTGGSGDGGPGPGSGDDGGPGPGGTSGGSVGDDSTGDIELDLLIPDIDFAESG